jgi:hypothetical protein
MANQSWNEGTSNHNGVSRKLEHRILSLLTELPQIFQRANTSGCEPYSPVIKEWCDKGDIYCDAGNVTGVHGTYFANYTKAATNWIVSKWNESLAATNSSGSPTGTASPTASGTAASSSSSTAPPTVTNAAGMLQSSSFGLVGFLAVAGAAFGTLL